MSLFTVLKYSGTDLGSEEELNSLPTDIFNKFYLELGGSLTHYGFRIISVSDWYTARPESVKLATKKSFMKILSEYEDGSVHIS